MIIPKLRFPEFIDEWQKHTLDQITETIGDGTHFSPEIIKSGPRKYITSKNIKDGYLSLGNVNHISEDAHKKIYKGSPVEYGDILLTKDGASTGTLCINTLNEEFSLLSSVAYIRANDTRTINSYIYQYLRSPIGQREIKSVIAGQAITRITLAKLGKFKICSPSMSEQRKIADFLTIVDEKITSIDKKVELLKQYKKGVMQKILTQQIRFKDEGGNSYPNWKNLKMSEVFDEVISRVGGAKAETYSITAGKGFVSQASKFGKDISGNQNKNYILLDKGEFSYNKGNSKTYTYGCVYVNNEGKQIAVPNVFISFKLKDNSMATNFYKALFEHHYLDRYLRQIISSGARMDGLLNVSKRDFFDIKVPVPNINEQQKIADFLSAIDGKLKAEEIKLASAKKFKKALLQRMFV